MTGKKLNDFHFGKTERVLEPVAVVEVQSAPLCPVATFTVKYLPSTDQDPGFRPQP